MRSAATGGQLTGIVVHLCKCNRYVLSKGQDCTTWLHQLASSCSSPLHNLSTSLDWLTLLAPGGAGVPGGALQAFPTQRVWLRGRFNSVKVQLLGYELCKAPEQIQVSLCIASGLLAAACSPPKAWRHLLCHLHNAL
jgi:hypothetical protein